MTPYYSDKAYNRLKKEFEKYDTIYIGFDFDNTIWDYDTYQDNYVYDKNAICWHIVYLLQEAAELGMTLCLWSSCPNGDKDLEKKLKICKRCGLKVKYANCSPLSPWEGKQHFNLLLDDKAGLESAVDILTRLIDEHTLSDSEGSSDRRNPYMVFA